MATERVTSHCEVFGAVVVVHGVVLDDDFLTLEQVCGEKSAEFFYLMFFSGASMKELGISYHDSCILDAYIANIYICVLSKCVSVALESEPFYQGS